MDDFGRNSSYDSLSCEGFEPADENCEPVVIDDGEGNEVVCEFLGLVKYQANDYGVFFPTEVYEGDSGELVILKLAAVGEGTCPDTFETLNDLDTVRAVFEIFKKANIDRFDFED